MVRDFAASRKRCGARLFPHQLHRRNPDEIRVRRVRFGDARQRIDRTVPPDRNRVDVGRPLPVGEVNCAVIGVHSARDVPRD